jgi:hypothetical protein
MSKIAFTARLKWTTMLVAGAAAITPMASHAQEEAAVAVATEASEAGDLRPVIAMGGSIEGAASTRWSAASAPLAAISIPLSAAFAPLRATSTRPSAASAHSKVTSIRSSAASAPFGAR